MIFLKGTSFLTAGKSEASAFLYLVHICSETLLANLEKSVCRLIQTHCAYFTVFHFHQQGGLDGTPDSGFYEKSHEVFGRVASPLGLA